MEVGRAAVRAAEHDSKGPGTRGPPRSTCTGGRGARWLPPRAWAIVAFVSAEAELLLEAVLQLPHRERVQLMTVLADSVEGDDEADEVERAWVEEAKRRLAGIRSGERVPVPWEAVEARLLSG